MRRNRHNRPCRVLRVNKARWEYYHVSADGVLACFSNQLRTLKLINNLDIHLLECQLLRCSLAYNPLLFANICPHIICVWVNPEIRNAVNSLRPECCGNKPRPIQVELEQCVLDNGYAFPFEAVVVAGRALALGAPYHRVGPLGNISSCLKCIVLPLDKTGEWRGQGGCRKLAPPVNREAEAADVHLTEPLVVGDDFFRVLELLELCLRDACVQEYLLLLLVTLF